MGSALAMSTLAAGDVCLVSTCKQAETGPHNSPLGFNNTGTEVPLGRTDLRTQTCFAVLVTAGVLVACASASSVIATGPETYMVTGQADLGPNKTAAARQAAIDTANAHCAKLGGKRPVVDNATNEDVGSAGVFQLRGGTTLTFRCIEQPK